MASNQQAIPQVQIDHNTPVKEWPRIINQIQLNLINAFNRLSMSLTTAISEVKYAYCTEAQFQAVYGSGWVLIDGRAVPGTKYASMFGPTIPDQRGCVPRMKDNGRGLNPDGDLALGAYQADQFGSHTHIQDAHHHGYATLRNGLLNGSGVAFSANDSTLGNGTSTADTTATNQSSGGNETRAKSSTINAFIRIN